MPHDKNGTLLQVGDVVIIEAVVKEIYASEEYCNVRMETVNPMPPYKDGTGITLNTKQVEKTGKVVKGSEAHIKAVTKHLT